VPDARYRVSLALPGAFTFHYFTRICGFVVQSGLPADSGPRGQRYAKAGAREWRTTPHPPLICRLPRELRWRSRRLGMRPVSCP